jgi:hypothetical protein
MDFFAMGRELDKDVVDKYIDIFKSADTEGIIEIKNGLEY